MKFFTILLGKITIKVWKCSSRFFINYTYVIEIYRKQITCWKASKFKRTLIKTLRIKNHLLGYYFYNFFLFLLRPENLIHDMIQLHFCCIKKYQKSTATILFYKLLKLEFNYKQWRTRKTENNFIGIYMRVN